jgi:hypothetical protein
VVGLSVTSLGSMTPLTTFLIVFATGYIGGVLSLLWEDILLAIAYDNFSMDAMFLLTSNSTALFGSVIMADAVDKLAFRVSFGNTLLNEYLYVFSLNLNQEIPIFEGSKTFWIMFGVTGLVALIGFVFQLIFSSKW